MRTILLAILAGPFFLSGITLAEEKKPIRVLVITGDEFHKRKETAPFIKDVPTEAGDKVDLTETPSKDLMPENLANYDVLVLNYRNTDKGAKDHPASVWSDDNKRAFLDAVKDGKGLYVYHGASSAFTSGSDLDKEFEKCVAGGWRKQGSHGKAHQFKLTVRKEHPITAGLKDFKHNVDELYQNSLIPAGSEVLATAYSEKAIDPKNTGRDEAVVWVNHYGKGRVVENVLGHDVAAMKDPGFQVLLIRGVEWAATGKATHRLPKELQK
jgi:type 1 glutamine amidotransferase